jgi:hypothetical protein
MGVGDAALYLRCKYELFGDIDLNIYCNVVAFIQLLA